MLAKHEQPPIIDPFETERRNGEILISRLRLVILLGFVPILYIIRFFTGYISIIFIPLVIGKWIIMCVIAYMVYYILHRGYYRHFIGYCTITLDLAFITISVITLSFYKSMPTGAMNDPVFILYYLVGISSVLRYDYSYVIFSISFGIAIIASLAAFDINYFHIPLDASFLIDRIAAFVFSTLMAIPFSKLIKESIAHGYNIMERHLRVIDAILDIGRKIASHSELTRSLKNITIKAKELLQFDVCWILLYDGSSWKVSGISDDDLPESFQNPELIRAADTKALQVFAMKPDLSMHGQAVVKLIGTPITIGQGITGALLAARFNERPDLEQDHALLDMFAEHVAICIENSRLLQQIRKETVYLHKQLDDISCFEDIIGTSARMREVFALIGKVAGTDMPVLIMGESGTGKELVAQALHNLSQRTAGPFIKVNCAAIPSELLESELFGYEKGAFTGAHKAKKGRFELADSGTIFLDEIGDMSIGLQGKLLRILQGQEFERIGSEVTLKVDVRLITATNQNLADMISKGTFREDLYYRINTLPIRMPPLRERNEDIPLLVRFFMNKYSPGKAIEFTRSAMENLMQKEWKGNVRELENLLKRIIIMTDKDIVSEEDILAIDSNDNTLGIQDYATVMKEHISTIVRNSCTVSTEMERIEREFISEALRLTNGNVRKAATHLGIPKSTLFNKLSKYDIKV
ncbi:MAG: sigma 54-interacting transcriptional regulator [Deltaproteobacteria bacterium]|nr:sigma 54-interacting transcriptional regulator [Deltaproteobacteria bacterium]